MWILKENNEKATKKPLAEKKNKKSFSNDNSLEESQFAVMA